MRRTLIALILVAGATANADELKRGEIVDGLACASDRSVTYAYYLPSAYDGKRFWPVVYVFDPRKRGAVAAEFFRDAAERYGWIVISSNNTESDADAGPSIHAIETMVPDAQQRFAIDKRRIYLAGFSGTAIIAWAFAAQTKGIAGVIGCSGRPLPDRNYGVSFNWFGTAGTRDFNYRETFEIDRGLAAAGANHRLEIFDGPHRWAPPEVLQQGIAWMELLAMKAGMRPRDDELVRRLFDAEMSRSDPDVLAKVRRYESIVRTFDGLLPVDEPRRRVSELRATPEFARAVKDEKAADKLEQTYRDRAARVIQTFMNADDVPIAASLAHDLQITWLQHVAEKSSYEGLAAQRVLEMIYAQTAFYAPREAAAQKLPALKAVSNMIHPRPGA